MITLKGRVAVVEADGSCLIAIPNDSPISDIIRVSNANFTKGQPVNVIIEPIKVRAAKAGMLIPSAV